MMHPVGSLSPAVYWRRRLLVLAPLLLVVLTGYVAGSSSDRPAAAPTTSRPAAQSSTGALGSGDTARSGSTTQGSRAPAAAGGPARCVPSVLVIGAVAGKPAFKVDDQPTLLIQVVNKGSVPCVEDLSDRQIELLVYNGSSRVWGSHDCQIEPGSSPQTLPVGAAVRRSIVWSGLSSEPGCANTRQRVGVGSYTLHAKLGGVEGATAPFTVS